MSSQLDQFSIYMRGEREGEEREEERRRGGKKKKEKEFFKGKMLNIPGRVKLLVHLGKEHLCLLTPCVSLWLDMFEDWRKKKEI